MINNLRRYEPYREAVLNLSLTESIEKVDAFMEDFKKMRITSYQNGDYLFKKILLRHDEAFHPIPKGLNCVIIDLEGRDPVKLLGLLVRDTIYSYCLRPGKVGEFYVAMLRLLRIIHRNGLLFFGFTYWDYDRLLEVRNDVYRKFSQKTEELEFLDNLKYFSLQERDKQSITETLYSMGLPIPKDPLFRTGRKVNDLYDDGFIEIVRQHNNSCLKAESLLLYRLYLRKHLLFARNRIPDKSK